MAYQVFDKKTGKMVWVDDRGRPIVNYNPGMGSLPGQAERREAELLSRLPDAQLAGFRGPSVVDPRPMRGARPEEPDPSPLHTYRPLAGAKQNNRGNTILVTAGGPAPGTGLLEFGSVVESPKNGGDDGEGIQVVCGYQLQGVNDSLDTSPLLIPTPLDTPIRIVGLLTFGTGGANFECEFDWNQGVSFTVPASYARIGARIDPTVTPDQFTIALSAALNYGPGNAGLSRARKTYDALINLNAGEDSITKAGNPYRVPPFAVSFNMGVDATSADLEIRFFDCFPTFTRSRRYRYVSNTNLAMGNETEFPVPSWARYFGITNNGFNSISEPDMIFTLGF